MEAGAGNKIMTVFHRRLTTVDPRSKVKPGRLFSWKYRLRTWSGFAMMEEAPRRVRLNASNAVLGLHETLFTLNSLLNDQPT